MTIEEISSVYSAAIGELEKMVAQGQDVSQICQTMDSKIETVVSNDWVSSDATAAKNSINDLTRRLRAIEPAMNELKSRVTSTLNESRALAEENARRIEANKAWN